ncbi:MAG: AbrB/MazE/SpoVT family DNA-binding domain-containing protein [Nanoarchaeota archaeon]|nr:AbrB/MazE/SpoVT family DNA-binding domain-containing protein [Nanoarchaeota archaeon]
MEIATTILSSKGQVVIPLAMRRGFETGERLIILQENNSIILKKADTLKEYFKEDLEFERRTREAQESIDRGEGIEMDFDDFISEMKKW